MGEFEHDGSGSELEREEEKARSFMLRSTLQSQSSQGLLRLVYHQEGPISFFLEKDRIAMLLALWNFDHQKRPQKHGEGKNSFAFCQEIFEDVIQYSEQCLFVVSS